MKPIILSTHTVAVELKATVEILFNKHVQV